jgi:exonuclease V
VSRQSSLTTQRTASTTTVIIAATPEEPVQPEGEDPEAASRSPYDRFRARKKCLSVTDLVSNIWCEQQFEYTLVRGFRRRTPEMARGTAVHKALEDQVHTTVEVGATTKEDYWGLKLFNMCQGMRSLRAHGLTRELPVFGFLGDIFVRGIIDEISYVNPRSRPGAGKEIPEQKAAPRRRNESTAPDTSSAGTADVADDLDMIIESETFSVPEKGERTAYLSDTKTRASRSFPRASQAHATAIQLMLYRRLLSDLHAGTVDLGKAIKLFDLDGSAQFSDNFIASIAGLDDNLSLETLLEHNSLWGMWKLLHEQMGKSMDNIGGEMGVSYRLQADGSRIGIKVFDNDDKMVDEHLDEVLQWWRGQRSTVGVGIEEAWKCKRHDDCSSRTKPVSWANIPRPVLRV